MQRGGSSQDIVGDVRAGAGTFDDSSGILAPEDESKVLVKLRKKQINWLAGQKRLRFGKFVEYAGSSRAPSPARGLHDHRAERKALLGTEAFRV